MIPIGFRAVGRPNELGADDAVVSDTDPFLDAAWLAESGLSDDCEVESRGVLIGEVAILAWRGNSAERAF